MDSSEPLVSIIIPTFNRDVLLKHGLDSINTLNIPWAYEIIVLDEFVGTATEDLCKQYSNIRYIRTRPNETEYNVQWRTPGLAINHGVKQSRGKYIILACPEIYHFDKDNLVNLITPLLDNTCVITHTEGVDDQDGDLLIALSNKTTDTFTPKAHFGMRDLCTRYAFFLAMNKSDFMRVGGYDEDFQNGYCFDDTNFSKRLENAGCKFVKVPGLIAHIYHKRLRYNLTHIKELWYKNEALYHARISDTVANVGREWGNI